MEAWRESGNVEKYPEAGEPWRIEKLYYDRIFNPKRMRAVNEEYLKTDPPAEVVARMEEMKSWMQDRPDLATTRVLVGEYFEHRDRALRSHASQVAPDSTFFFWPNDIQRAVWPYEDFQLVESRVETELPENDLFAGVVDDQPDGGRAAADASGAPADAATADAADAAAADASPTGA